MRALIFIAVAALGCGKKASKQEPVASGSAPAGDASVQADAPVAAEPPWELRSKPVELDCVPTPPAAYKAALDAGRAAGKAKNWGDAVAAFEAALAAQKDDPVALGELAWATLQTGDAQRSLELAEKAITVANGPNAQAASHFNAARAAQALGDLALAKTHFEKSLELRPSDAIKEQLAKLAAPAPRTVPPSEWMSACQDQPTIDEACKCLATSGKAVGLDGKATCEPAKERGTRAQLVVVQEQPADPEAAVGGSAIVLVAKRGETWSAVQVVERSGDVDLAETPRAVHGAEVRAYEERGTTIWVETQNQYSETDAGDHEVRGQASLTLCTVPTAAAERASCSGTLPLAIWDYTQNVASETCDVRTMFAYRAMLKSDGMLTLVLATGGDASGRAGRYQR